MIARQFKWVFGILMALVCAAPAVFANDEEVQVYDRVSLSAGAESKVANDLLSAVLYTQREGSDASRLASEVNKAVDWAVKESGKVPEVRVQTLEYRTHPIYNKQTLKGWRVRQSIRLESADTSRLSDLVGRLQKRVSVETISYKLSPDTRKKAEDELIRRAIDEFGKRAALITKQLGRPGYRLVNMDVGTGAVAPRPMMRGMAMAVAADAAPTLEPGTQTVNVRVSGTIELQVQ